MNDLERQLQQERQNVRHLEQQLKEALEQQGNKETKLEQYQKNRIELLEKQMDFVCKFIDNVVLVLFGERFGQFELASDDKFKAFKTIRKLVDKSSLGSPQIMAQDFKPGFYDMKNTGPQG